MSLPERILVRAPNWIGDHVMAFPFYRGLRGLFERAHLCLLCPESLSDLADPSIFQSKRLLQAEDRCFPLGAWRCGRRLVPERFDMAISLPASLSSALLLLAARIPARIGFAGDGSALLLTRSVRWRGREAGRHKSELYLDLLREIQRGSGGAPGELEGAPPVAAAKGREPLILVAPGASIPLREWPYFRELLPRLRARYPSYRIVVVGAAPEAKWHERLLPLSHLRIEDYIEKTTLSELIILCKRARLVIANDSGIAHLGATLALAPTLVLFGPGDPAYVRPIGPEVFEARAENVPCSPCEKPYCRAPQGYQRCLRALSLEAVVQKIESALPPL